MKISKNENQVSLSEEFSFYEILFQLKNLYRQGWLQAGISKEHCESIADHSFALAMLCLKYQKDYPEMLDMEKMLKMTLIHDLAEAVIGDITPSEEISLKDKFSMEKEAIESILSHFPDSDELLDIWLDFETGGSSTALYVKQMDKIEMMLQALVYQNHSVDLSSFFESTEKQMQNDFFKDLRLKIINKAKL
ncbi:MAG TPA: HD domain-containing protein [Candidatus Cloacimonadota bacterium]|nr:HD domain-containing protein [Candidatus Cloacimonadota bacterium]HOD53429.1 HD domain-containing protein [Candidatus Cloacimonadota bacterium]HPM03833.1 HD domain-containing protein [Candidatus Cloacimonadota bacterium]